MIINPYFFGVSLDPDAQAFLTAAAITNPTISGAINTLVVQMKANNIWSKMKAIYPFVGGTASTHKFNLKDPRNLDAAYRLVFSGGLTHNSTGILGNGVNGSFNTFLNPSTTFTSLTGASLFVYVRNNTVTGQDFGAFQSVVNYRFSITSRATGNLAYASPCSTNFIQESNLNSLGFWGSTRPPSSNTYFLIKNASFSSNTGAFLAPNTNVIGLSLPFIGQFSDRHLAFSCIADGLTTSESETLRTAVQNFQTTLGRSIGTQTVSDADAQAFVTNAAIVDQVEANAVNKLVIDMKAAGVWSKMKAIYPFVGGSASSHKFNLKDPRDLNAAFRLVFNGGWTHSSNGAQPNGTNGFADTFLVPSTSLSASSLHFSKYNRNNDLVGNKIDGAVSNFTDFLQQNYSAGNAVIGTIASLASYTQTDTRGLFTATRTASNLIKVFRNSSSIATNTTTISILPNVNLFIGARCDGFAQSFFNSYQCAFSSIGDGLSDTEAANLYTAVQNFQTTLNRQV
jgi:hypothetical protein